MLSIICDSHAYFIFVSTFLGQARWTCIYSVWVHLISTEITNLSLKHLQINQNQPPFFVCGYPYKFGHYSVFLSVIWSVQTHRIPVSNRVCTIQRKKRNWNVWAKLNGQKITTIFRIIENGCQNAANPQITAATLTATTAAAASVAKRLIVLSSSKHNGRDQYNVIRMIIIIVIDWFWWLEINAKARSKKWNKLGTDETSFAHSLYSMLLWCLWCLKFVNLRISKSHFEMWKCAMTNGTISRQISIGA